MLEQRATACADRDPVPARIQPEHFGAPCASPFAKFKQWPAPGYRQQDFPKTEAIVHTFLALPIGIKYTEEDADYIAAAVRQVRGELLG